MANLPMPEGLTTSDLECVMLEVKKIEWEEGYTPSIRDFYGPDFNPNDLFYGDIPELKYAQGAVYDDVPHVTLLFGIHPSLTYPEDVDAVLSDWTVPDIHIKYVGFFDSRIEGQDYYCIVGFCDLTAWLLNGHMRLKGLPYTSSYDEYKPHMTLAYIKKSADLSVWLERMNAAFANRIFVVEGLDLGLDE